MKARTFHCPRCRRRVSRKASHFPFCSERCRLIDLGQWLGEEYRVPGVKVSLPADDGEGRS